MVAGSLSEIEETVSAHGTELLDTEGLYREYIVLCESGICGGEEWQIAKKGKSKENDTQIKLICT